MILALIKNEKIFVSSYAILDSNQRRNILIYQAKRYDYIQNIIALCSLYKYEIKKHEVFSLLIPDQRDML